MIGSKAGGRAGGRYLHFPEEHFPLGHSELKLHFPSGAFEHLPLRHLAPLKPQSESKLQQDPDAHAQRLLQHFAPLQSDLKLQSPGFLASMGV